MLRCAYLGGGQWRETPPENQAQGETAARHPQPGQGHNFLVMWRSMRDEEDAIAHDLDKLPPILPDSHHRTEHNVTNTGTGLLRYVYAVANAR